MDPRKVQELSQIEGNNYLFIILQLFLINSGIDLQLAVSRFFNRYFRLISAEVEFEFFSFVP